MSNAATSLRRAAQRVSQRGVGLVEIMVAIVIALFLLLALYNILITTRSTYQSQTQLVALQDSERLVNTVVTDVVQSASYFPDPQVETRASALPADATFLAAGQGVFGTASATPPGDTLSVRYTTAPNDGILNCLGDSNTSVANTLYVNRFSVDATNGLMCSINGAAPQTLVPGVTNMSVLYGVDTAASGAPTQYLAASAMTPAYWTAVKSVRVTLTFNNPLFPQPGQPATVTFTRVIALLNAS